ncbi:MAG TPA: 4Fe-4S dicluster domain-containing protein, partial [Rhodocyclaceae bacterium]|nr:4Fe-4S dicluster domain-containing protein [Rhodocyclaceae bacterium]
DVRAFDGTAGIVQPAIAPLYDTRSALEVLALLDDDTLRSGHDLVQRFWRQRIGEQRFDDFWNASLRQGFITDSSMAVIHGEEPPAPQTPAIVPPSSADSLTAIFAEDAAVADGSFANIGWLQELPRSASKLTWDNAVLIGPKTAENLQLRDGSVVRLARGNRALEAPVLVMPTHAENCITLPLGYGRRNAGRVGNGVGFDAYSLRPLTGSVAQVRLTRTGRQYDFAITQHETSMHGRDIVRTVAARNAAAAQHKQQPSLYPQPQSPVHAWAMNIDLDACIGCNACTIACQAENNIPVVGKEEVKRGRVMHWIRVDRYIERRNARDLMLFQPVPCMHCEDAPCEAVCPVGATVHDSEGLNVQVYNRCVGTRFCSNNCPYKVRRFNFLAYANTEVESLKALQNPDVTVRRRGVMEKCSYCVQRISRARINAERSGTPLVDGDVVTACEAACPTQAIVFGDLRDANSRVSSARKSSRHYVLLEELNTRPRTTYLARVLDSDDGEVS